MCQDECLLEEAKVRYASCLLEVRARDCWKGIGREVYDDVVDAISGDDFSIRSGAYSGGSR